MIVLRDRRIVGAAAILGYLSFVLLTQWHLGTFQAECGSAGFPDEPSHYLSGLMIHDYLTSGLLQAPLAYAERYYLHVPYFAIGYWPPLFYITEALWMICFGVARSNVVVLTALISGAISTILFMTVRRIAGTAAAFGIGLLFLLAPEVRQGGLAIMTDLPVALLSLLAILVLARYIDGGRPRDAVLFSLLASATILTKSSGLVLGALPPLAVLLTGRLYFFGKLSFWAMAGLVAVLCAPWFLLTRSLISIGFVGIAKTFPSSLAFFSATPWHSLGVLLIFSMAGAMWWIRRGPLNGLPALCIVYPIVSALFFAISPTANEGRYMIATFPPLLILAASGIAWLAQTAGSNSARRQMVAAVVVALLVIVPALSGAFHVIGITPSPVQQIARYIADSRYQVVLVNGDAEGSTIASVATLEAHRASDRYMVRPNKLFGRSNWMGTWYTPLYRTPQEVETVLEQLPVDAVVLRKELNRDAVLHDVLLQQAVTQVYPERWRKVYAASSGGVEYDVFEPVVTPVISQDRLEKSLRNVLNHLL